MTFYTFPGNAHPRMGAEVKPFIFSKGRKKVSEAVLSEAAESEEVFCLYCDI